MYGKKPERRSSREEMSAATAAAPLPQPPRVVPTAMGASHHHSPGPPSPSKEVRRALARSPSTFIPRRDRDVACVALSLCHCKLNAAGVATYS